MGSVVDKFTWFKSDVLATKKRMVKPANNFFNNVVDKASIQLAIYKLIKCNELDIELEKLDTEYSRGDNWISFDSTIEIDNDGIEDLIKACF